MAATPKLKVIKASFHRLYVTRARNTGPSEAWQGYVDGRTVVPSLGTFCTDLSYAQWFTMHPLVNYGDDWTGLEWVHLQYTPVDAKTVLTLFDNRSTLSHVNAIKVVAEHPELDGYIGTEDGYEIYLKAPAKYLKPNPEVIKEAVANTSIAEYKRINGICDRMLADPVFAKAELERDPPATFGLGRDQNTRMIRRS